MKILFGMPSADSHGGVVASEPPIAEALRRSGVTILSEDYVYGTAVEIGTLGRIRRVVRTALRFRKVIKDGDLDIIHLNSSFDKRSVLRDAASIFLIGRTKARVFLKVHGASLHEFTRPSLLYKVLIRYLGSRVDGFGIHTEDEMNGLERLGLDRERFHVILNSVVVDDAKPQGYVRIQKEPSDSFKLLFAGRFVETKGLLETIRACARLQERGVRFTLECCGDGPLRSAAERLVDELDVRTELAPQDEVPGATGAFRCQYEHSHFVGDRLERRHVVLGGSNRAAEEHRERPLLAVVVVFGNDQPAVSVRPQDVQVVNSRGDGCRRCNAGSCS